MSWSGGQNAAKPKLRGAKPGPGTRGALTRYEPAIPVAVPDQDGRERSGSITRVGLLCFRSAEKMLITPPKLHKDSKLGKRAVKRAQEPS